MQFEFSAVRPDGDYALVVPAAGKDQSGLNSFPEAGQLKAALARQRFEGESGSSAELFVNSDGQTRRLLVIGTGIGPIDGEGQPPQRVSAVRAAFVMWAGRRSKAS